MNRIPARRFLIVLGWLLLMAGSAALVWWEDKLSRTTLPLVVCTPMPRWKTDPGLRPWRPPTDPFVLLELDDPESRSTAIDRLDLGPPTAEQWPYREYSRIVPLLPSLDGSSRELRIFRRLGNGCTESSWTLLEAKVEVDSGAAAFYYNCGS